MVGYSVTNPDDVDGLNATGQFVVADGGNTQLKITPNKDYQTEGVETLTFTLISSNFGGTQWQDKSVSIQINDTTRPPTYQLVASKASIDEGDPITITLKTTNVDEGVEVSYVLTNILDLGVVNPGHLQ